MAFRLIRIMLATCLIQAILAKATFSTVRSLLAQNNDNQQTGDSSATNEPQTEELTPLMKASLEGNIADIDKYATSKYEVNKATEKNKRTALFFAVDENKIECIQKLVEKGADINYKDLFGGTALMEALFSGKIEAAQELIKLKAEVNEIVNLSALDIASIVDINDAQTIKLLEDHGAKTSQDILKNSGSTSSSVPSAHNQESPVASKKNEKPVGSSNSCEKCEENGLSKKLIIIFGIIEGVVGVIIIGAIVYYLCKKE